MLTQTKFCHITVTFVRPYEIQGFFVVVCLDAALIPNNKNLMSLTWLETYVFC